MAKTALFCNDHALCSKLRHAKTYSTAGTPPITYVRVLGQEFSHRALKAISRGRGAAAAHLPGLAHVDALGGDSTDYSSQHRNCLSVFFRLCVEEPERVSPQSVKNWFGVRVFSVFHFSVRRLNTYGLYLCHKTSRGTFDLPKGPNWCFEGFISPEMAS